MMMMTMLETSSRRYHHRPTRTHTTGLQATPSSTFERIHTQPLRVLAPGDKFNFVAISGYLLREPSASSLLRRLRCCILGTSFLVIRGDESIYRRWSIISQGDAAFASIPTRCPIPSLMLLVEPKVDGSRPLWRLDEVRGDESTVIFTEVSWRKRQICAAHSLLPLRTSKWLPFKVLCVGVDMYFKPLHSNRSDHGSPLLTRALRPELEDGRIEWLSRPLPFFLIPNSCTVSKISVA